MTRRSFFSMFTAAVVIATAPLAAIRWRPRYETFTWEAPSGKRVRWWFKPSSRPEWQQWLNPVRLSPLNFIAEKVEVIKGDGACEVFRFTKSQRKQMRHEWALLWSGDWSGWMEYRWNNGQWLRTMPDYEIHRQRYYPSKTLKPPAAYKSCSSPVPTP